jgi:RNA polymerase sigma-70 factor (ECF subfamily)
MAPTNFEAVALPHLDAAYDLARWLLRDRADADDVVQDAYLKAFRAFGGFRGGSARAWLLTIVRNACYTRLRRRRPDEPSLSLDDGLADPPDAGPTPEQAVLRQAAARSLREALESLPIDLREAIVLRELEGLSYAEIAAVADVPIGTVMSRLSRARHRLQTALGGKESAT